MSAPSSIRSLLTFWPSGPVWWVLSIMPRISPARSRAIVFDERGRPRAAAQKEFRQIFPRPGWVEHDPEEIFRSQLACARSALRKAKLAPSRLAAIGITNQRETVVVWDRRTGKPAHRAIVWQDRRTAERCEELKKAGLAETIRAKT